MSEKSKKTGLSVAVFLLTLLIFLIFFLVKKDTIITNLQKTDFFERVFGSTPEFVKNHQPKIEQQQELIITDLNPNKIKETIQNINNKEEDIINLTEEPSPKPSTKKEETPKDTTIKNKENVPVKTETKVQQTPLTTTATLYFITVNSDGSISRKQIKRTLPKTDSPLTNSINSLLKGLEQENVNQNTMTLIPEGTKLISASVKDGIATLNFTENFEYNSFGVEGYIGQLMQIVYTATEFPTVKSVQFLIEGEHKDYLGSEGQWIGSPLSRLSFK